MKEMEAVLNAIIVLDNEAIRLRESTVGKSFKEKKRIFFDRKHIYYLIDRVLKDLYNDDILEITGYYLQTSKGNSTKIYINKIKGYDEEIYSQILYDKNSENIELKGDIGLTQSREVDTDMNFKEARLFLLNYLKNPNNIEVNAESKISNVKEDKEFKIKETKLVELYRLRVVKDTHINGYPLNPETTNKKKKELLEYLENNKGIYPKEEAILVWKGKDPKDRRRVVYNIEDGYRRYVLSEELGLEKIYVSIIEN